MRRCSWESAPSGCRLNLIEVLANDPRMPSGDAQQGNRGAFRMTPTLLPIPKSVNADTHGLSELLLGKPDETPESRDVLAGFELAEYEALPDTRGNGAGKVVLGQLWNVSHWPSSIYR